MLDQPLPGTQYPCTRRTYQRAQMPSLATHHPWRNWRGERPVRWLQCAAEPAGSPCPRHTPLRAAFPQPHTYRSSGWPSHRPHQGWHFHRAEPAGGCLHGWTQELCRMPAQVQPVNNKHGTPAAHGLQLCNDGGKQTWEREQARGRGGRRTRSRAATCFMLSARQFKLWRCDWLKIEQGQTGKGPSVYLLHRINDFPFLPELQNWI